MIIGANTTNLTTSSTAINGYMKVGNSSSQNEIDTTTGTEKVAATLTISAQGSVLSSQSQASREALAAINDVTSKDENSTLATIVGAETSEEDSEDDETTVSDLSSQTESQLSELVAEGTISQAEANAELERRKGSSSDSQSDGNTPPANPEQAKMQASLEMLETEEV